MTGSHVELKSLAINLTTQFELFKHLVIKSLTDYSRRKGNTTHGQAPLACE